MIFLVGSGFLRQVRASPIDIYVLSLTFLVMSGHGGRARTVHRPYEFVRWRARVRHLPKNLALVPQLQYRGSRGGFGRSSWQTNPRPHPVNHPSLPKSEPHSANPTTARPGPHTRWESTPSPHPWASAVTTSCFCKPSPRRTRVWTLIFCAPFNRTDRFRAEAHG